MTRRLMTIVAALACAAVLTGCLERKEHLTIAPDGGVWYVAEFKTNSLDELLEGDAIPSPAAGWAAEQTIERDQEGKETYKLLATTSIPRGGKLPSNFVAPGRGSADEHIYLQFPTSIFIEQRDDGVYYQFHRTYPARPWMYIERLNEQLVKQPLSKFEDIDSDDWNDDQRMVAVKALAAFESEKALIFARQAFVDTTPDAAQDGWLRAQADVREFVRQFDYADLASLLRPRKTREEERMRGEIVLAEVERFTRITDERVEAALRDLAGYDAATLSAFVSNYNTHRTLYEITRDLQDEKFEITVTMPGRIIAHNAEGSPTGVPGASTIVWTFDGPRLNDCDLELMASSFVPNRD